MDIILGTAGHIDHGKTSLVDALTGINCDRLEEERRRGITIELGFAWMDLPDGRRLGIVDVPGHERFVKNMVAGASGVDCILLVIAADEGVMPQTREHLEICSLLGVRSGIVALTKIDLVDEDWLNFVREDIKGALADTFLANVPIIPVSALDGQGLDKLRAEIVHLTSTLRQHSRSDILRLPVDRVFSMKGFGTVVTGTLISGSCAQGEKLCVMPAGLPSRARNLQVHGTQVESAHAGQRCAINMQGLEVEDIQRGDVVARPDTLFPTKSLFLRVNCLKSSPLPIRQRMELHFHHGSGECLAKIVFKDREALEPGESALAEVKFTHPLTAIYGDHCVLRAHSPLRAIGGGIVVDPLPPLLKKRDPDYKQKMAILQELGAPDKDNPNCLAPISPLKLVSLALDLCPPPGTDTRHLQVLTGLTGQELDQALAELEKASRAFCWDRSAGCWIASAELESCLEKCRQSAERIHAKDPLKSTFAQNELLAGWGENLPSRFVQEMLRTALSRKLLLAEGSGLKLSSHKIKLSPEESRILDLLKDRIKCGGFAPPFIRELAEENAWEIKKLAPLLSHLCDSGQLLKIQDGVYYDKEEFSRMVEKVRAWFTEHEELDVGAMKAIFGISRKYAIPVLEYLDQIHLTQRLNDKRRLRKD